jgi:hypothetical protein
MGRHSLTLRVAPERINQVGMGKTFVALGVAIVAALANRGKRTKVFADGTVWKI